MPPGEARGGGGVGLSAGDLDEGVAGFLAVSEEPGSSGTAFERFDAFEDGFFHADPHPGNLRILPDGRVGLFDFGQGTTANFFCTPIGGQPAEEEDYFQTWTERTAGRVEEVGRQRSPHDSCPLRAAAPGLFHRFDIHADDTNLAFDHPAG